MTIRTFWMLILRIIGLFLLIDSLYIFPKFFEMFIFVFLEEPFLGTIFLIALLLICAGVYIFILRLLLFKTGMLIEKLKLDKNFNEDKIDISNDKNTFLKLAVVVIGTMLLIDCVPEFFHEFFYFLQRLEVFRESPLLGPLIYLFVKMVIGFLLMTNSDRVTNLIIKLSSKEE